MLVTERVGRLRLIQGGSLRPEPIGGVPAVHTGSQAGLFDIVLHPKFAQNNIVYLTYAAGTKAPMVRKWRARASTAARSKICRSSRQCL